MARTIANDTKFYEVVTVFNFDGVTPLPGLTSANFVITFYKNNVVQAAPVHSIVEIGNTGDYALSVTNGFSSVGFWMIQMVNDVTNDTFRTDIQVSKDFLYVSSVVTSVG